MILDHFYTIKQIYEPQFFVFQNYDNELGA